MIRRFSVGYDVELHKRTLEQRAAVAARPRGGHRRRRGRPRRPRRRRRPRASGRRALPCRRRDRRGARALDPHRPRSRRCCARPRTPTRSPPRSSADGAQPVVRGGRRLPAHRARPPPLRNRSRRHRDPPGGGPQRPRGLVHQGLLRRPGDGRAPLLPRQAQPPAARPAALRGRVDRRRGDVRRPGVGRLGSVAESPSLGTIALALVRREAPPGSHVSVGSDQIKAVVVELPFAAYGTRPGPAGSAPGAAAAGERRGARPASCRSA